MPTPISQLTRSGWRTLTAPPPALTSNMLIGAASYHPPLSADASWTQVLAPQVGPMTVRRCYESAAVGIPASWEASAAALDIGRRASVYSVRPDITAFNAGQWDARLRNFLATIPADGMPKWLVPWHEADSKVRRGEYTRQAWLNAARRFGDIVHEADVADTYVTPCMTDWLWADPAKSAGQPEQWWQPDVYDVWSVDAYDQAPAAMFAAASQFARDHDIPWGVAETGMVDVPGNPAVKAQWIADVAAYCATRSAGGWPSATFLCWFDSAQNFPEDQAARAYTPTSSPESIAAATAVCAEHYRDPSTVTLP